MGMRVLNKKYWPYRIAVNSPQCGQGRIDDWLRENVTGQYFVMSFYEYYFAEEKDAMMFLLKWS